MTHQSDWMIKIIPLIFIKKFNNMDNNLFTDRAIAEFDLPKLELYRMTVPAPGVKFCA